MANKSILINKPKALKIWMFRRMLRVSWTDKIINKEILKIVGREHELLFNINKSNKGYLVNSKYQLLQLIVEKKKRRQARCQQKTDALAIKQE